VASGARNGDTQLHLIDLDQDLPGQRRFISCWVVQSAGEVFIVDPGPPSTADYLVGELERLGVDRLDHILLTHIHLDHGGATARILERWPQARVLCHKAGRSHLVDPQRLWEGSLQVLGRKAEVYGQPLPVPESSLAVEPKDVPAGLLVIPTPGHAPHHQSFLFDGNLFVGEAAGTFSDLGGGSGTYGYYLRPATPPRFFLPVAAGSLDRLLTLAPSAERICFAHHGEFTGDVPGLLRSARNQLQLWVETAESCLARDGGGDVPAAGPALDDLQAGILDRLRQVDPLFRRGSRLPADIRERERDFSRQTLRGILGYLSARAQD